MRPGFHPGKDSKQLLPGTLSMARFFALFHPGQPMTKQKTKKGVVKRMKLTKSGKVKRRQSFTSHIMVRRSRKRKRQLRKALILPGKMGKNMARALGQG